jgi:hypothetical protein
VKAVKAVGNGGIGKKAIEIIGVQVRDRRGDEGSVEERAYKRRYVCDEEEGLAVLRECARRLHSDRDGAGKRPYRYLCYLFNRLPQAKIPEAIDALLPCNLFPEHTTPTG